MQSLAPVSLFALSSLFYVLVGARCAKAFINSASNEDEVDLVMSLYVTKAGILLFSVLILLWPLWYALPKVYNVARSVFPARRSQRTRR